MLDLPNLRHSMCEERDGILGICIVLQLTNAHCDYAPRICNCDLTQSHSVGRVYQYVAALGRNIVLFSSDEVHPTDSQHHCNCRCSVGIFPLASCIIVIERIEFGD